MKLLVAEDDPRLLKSLVHILQTNKFLVDGVSTGTDAYEYARSSEYDGFVFDIMMPGMNGLELLKKLRSEGNSTPALFLTARTEVEQRVEGLDAGADDYISKPFATQELLARVRAMLRRRDAFQPDVLKYGGVSLNKSTYQLEYGESSKGLSAKEFQIMEMLMQQPHVIIPTEKVITHVWGWDTDVDTSVVWVHISNVRKKLEALAAPVEIRFVRGAGYVLEDKQ